MKLDEAKLSKEVDDALGRYPHVLVRRRVVGTYLAISGKLQSARDVLRSAGIGSRVVEVGITGEPDKDVLVGNQHCHSCGAPVHPRCVGLELKTLTGDQRKAQENYQTNIAGRRGLDYFVIRSVGHALTACGLGDKGK